MAEGDVIDQVTNFDIGAATSGFIDQAVVYLAWGGIALLLLGFIIMKIREWKIYKYPVRVFRRRENNSVSEINYRGGFLVNRDGIREFWVKTGRMPWMAKKLHAIPDANFMDTEGRVYYNLIDPDTWIQVQRTFLRKQMLKRKVELIQPYAGFKEGYRAEALENVAEDLVREGYAKYLDEPPIAVEVADALYEPVPSDVKQSVVSDLKNARAALGPDTTKQVAIFTVGLVIIAITFVVAYYFLTNRPG